MVAWMLDWPLSLAVQASDLVIPEMLLVNCSRCCWYWPGRTSRTGVSGARTSSPAA